jgi:dCMP deaminase
MSASINWDDYFMSIAILVSLRSKDPSSKVGAVLVNNNKIIGTGYNGFPTGCDESQLPWDRDIEGEGWLNTKYPYVIHAEANALLNTVASPKGCSVYVTLFPCNECSKLLIQGGVKEVVFLQNKYPDQEAFVAAKKILELTGIKTRELPPAEINIEIISEYFSKLKEK